MSRYKRMIDSMSVMPNLKDVHSLGIDAEWFFATLTNGEIINLVDVSLIKQKTDAFNALCYYAAERMREEGKKITSLAITTGVLT